jgi:mRNA degradation ribonuclease J1/J2
MSLIRLYIDEDAMDRRFIEALRGRGVDLMTAGETQTRGFSDEEQLILAQAVGRVFFTFNVGDFCRLHGQFSAAERNHAGIIVSSQDYSIGEQMRRVLKLMSVESSESMINQIVFLSSYSGEL